MKVIESNKSITSGMVRTVKQTIAANRIDHATYLLRDKIYSDKLKATITETTCNAVDEHRKHNISRPVDIILTASELCIRDYAKGLSIEGVEQIFFQYFESTKSGDNNGIGGFGIGAKAPSSYADVYYVISYHEGKRHMFVSNINGFAAEASLVYSEDYDPNDTGICIRIPLNSKHAFNDYIEFKHLAIDLAIQIGFYSDKNEVNVYVVDSKMEYDEFITKSDEFKNSKLVESSTFSYLRELRTKDNRFYIPDLGIVYRRPSYRLNDNDYAKYQFHSNFFKNKRFMAYDGDICYQFDIPEEILREFELNTSDYNYIFFFKRGELNILPTRESIEINDLAIAWAKDRVKKLRDYFMDKTEKMFNSEMITGNTAYYINSHIKNSISEYISFFKVINWGKYTMSDKDIAMAFSSVDNHYTNGEYDVSVSKASNRYSNNIVNGYKNIIYIINNENKKPNLPRTEIVNAFRNYFISLYGEDLYIKNYTNLTTTFVIISSDNIDAFETYKKNFKFKGTEVLRKNVDYYDYKDIKAKSTFVRKASNNKAAKTFRIYDYYATSTEIDESEYDKTVIISPSDITNNVNNIKDLIAYFNTNGYHTYTAFCSFVGIKHFTKCYKNSFDKFKAAGCKSLEDIDFKKQLMDFIKKSETIAAPSIYYLIKEAIGENELYKDSVDLNNIFRPFNGNRYITKTNETHFNNLINIIIGRKFINDHISSIVKDIENELLNYNDEELLDITCLFELWNSTLNNNALCDSSFNIKDRLKKLLRNKKKKIGEKYHDKLLSLLQKIKLTF